MDGDGTERSEQDEYLRDTNSVGNRMNTCPALWLESEKLICG